VAQERRSSSRATITIALVAMAIAGCVMAPVKAPMIEGPVGTVERWPKETLVPGKTTRVEVEERYKRFAMEAGLPNLFWGRFRESGWKLVGGPIPGGYVPDEPARVWSVHNLLISFDSGGVVKTQEIIDDENLVERLGELAMAQGVPPLDLAQPVSISGQEDSMQFTLVLTAGGVAVTGERLPYPWEKPEPVIRTAMVPVAQVEKLSVGLSYWTMDTTVRVAFRFAEKTAVGREVVFNARPDKAVLLARWMQQVKPEKK
jgi:hypothetical protein